MKLFTICLLSACSSSGYAGKLRASAPIQADENATFAKTLQRLHAQNATFAKLREVAKERSETLERLQKVERVQKVHNAMKKSQEVAEVASKEEQAPQQGVSMQIPDEEVQAFLGKLSAGCESQYTAMFSAPHDQGLHTFGSPGVDSTAESCQRLNGSLCATMAHIAQQTSNGSGRSMSTTVEVKGNGCLPKACISKKDLAVLAAFMHSKAKSSGKIAGEGADLDLHVDCTESGGSVADSPGDEHAHEEEAEHSKEDAKHEDSEHHEHDEHDHKHDEHDDHEHSEHDKHEAKSAASRFGGFLAIVPTMGVLQLFA